MATFAVGFRRTLWVQGRQACLEGLPARIAQTAGAGGPVHKLAEHAAGARAAVAGQAHTGPCVGHQVNSLLKLELANRAGAA
jgi:hypothetical protein